MIRKRPLAANVKRPRKMIEPTSKTKLGVTAGAIGCGLILLVLVVGAVLEDRSSDAYYIAVQEDELLEWATTWAFLIAAGVAVAASRRQWKRSRKRPWFLLGVGLFCFVVGMEEISWGQRVLGFRPPDYFLENNFQQELNVHNVISTDLRKLAVKAVILGYGVLFPLLVLVPALPRKLASFAIVLPPVSLAPAFLAAFWLYESYPWSHSGEWVELMMGLGFLFAMIAAWVSFRDFKDNKTGRAAFTRLSTVAVLVATLAVGLLGMANATISRSQRAGSEEILEVAQREVDALRDDFLSGKVQSRCNRHKRVYTFMRDYDQPALLEGSFAALQTQGLPEARADFFLDPWNSPYWIRDRCSKSRGKRLTFVYSFGPNRRRDSTRYEILGDDIGAWVRQEPRSGW